jgi:Rod binding domain-containing protein
VSAADFSLGAITATTQNLTQAKSSQAINALQSQSKDGDSKKIDKAAKDFESILLGEWLQKAEQSFATVPGTDPDQQNDSAYDQFQSISCQFLGEALSKGGGIGIASMISKNLKAMEATRNAAETAKKAGTGQVAGTPQSR